ncbi:NapC/NirT family cytochrome c [Opitutales bacterium ASA1]|uniref:cytochrome c3 family protein n=1 Tax=Congregicoccus parvus TaxID=3081749 RepID=UPI002B2E5220|nr:NapC/NirT family cytochrome c [Opitutales bacterium ASA1]
MNDAPRAGIFARITGLFFRTWISLAGFILSVGAAFAFCFLFAIDLFAHGGNPYMGILAYLVAPAFFFLGIGFVVMGWWIHRRRRRRLGDADAAALALAIDLSRPDHRRHLFFFLSGATVFLMVSALGSYRTYHFTESVQFCGQVCHTVMEPEYVTYQHGAHARVGCVDCHIGSGATWYVKSKLSGAYQVYATLMDDFERPIPTPVANLRPAQDTCEQCHWPEKFSGDRVKTYNHFLSDEDNTPYTIRLELKVGGGSPAHGPVGGIHWHMSVANKVEYIATDPQRQDIPWVRVTDAQGNVRVYATEEYRETPPPGEIRQMDCIDCHNRPAHAYKTPNHLVEQALALGRVDQTLPEFKRHAVDALVADYATREEAAAGIAARLREAYPDRPTVQGAIEELQRIYSVNFFPEMKARWDVYPDNIGHKDWAGCFRCHDDLHATADGSTMIKSSDCNACHLILAQGSGSALERVFASGTTFEHPAGDVGDLSCNLCHNGKNQE